MGTIMKNDIPYGGGGDYDDTELRNRIAIVETQKATGYFERTDFDIPLSTAGQPAFALAKDSFKIEVENHKPYTYEFTAGDVYNLSQYSETLGKIFIARNEDNETIHVKMTGPLPDNVQYTPVSSNPVLDFTNATATLTKTTFLKQIDEMLIPASSGEVFIFDVDGDSLTEDPDNPGGKHYGITLTSPTFEEIMDNLVSNKLVFARVLFNNGNTSEMYQVFRTSANSIRGKAFDLEFPQGYIWFYDIYIQKRDYGTTTYFGVFADKVSDGGSGGGGQDNVIESISLNGVEQSVDTNKNVDLAVYDIDEVDAIIGDLTSLTTTDKTNLVNAINEVYEKSGEPFRVKNWTGTFEVAIEPCTTDKTNAQLAKMVFSIDATEGADYQIVGMIAYEVFDAASGGNRLNVWPVCQFTGNGQKELSVRWVCAGTTTKTAKRINAWVLLKHR